MLAADSTNSAQIGRGGLEINLTNVSKTFPGAVRAIDDLSLPIAAGEFLAILGPSGCGKSTVLRVIAGLETVESGDVEIGSSKKSEVAQPFPDQSPIAYVFQDAHLLPWRNVIRNVALPLELLGVPKSTRMEAARSALQQVGLSDALTRYPAQLSGGMRMRVSLARALVTNPRLLLLDEPFAALDEITRQRLDEQLYALWQARGMTVLFITHSTTEAVYLAQRAVVFSARPARVVLDQTIDLPAHRPASLRAEPTFAMQTREVFRALESAEADRMDCRDSKSSPHSRRGHA